MVVAVRQMMGVMAQLDKAMTVSKLRSTRDRKSAEAGRRIEGRKGRPELISLAKRLSGEGLSLRQTAVRMTEQG